MHSPSALTEHVSLNLARLFFLLDPVHHSRKWLMALDNSRLGAESSAAAPHVDVVDPQVVDGAAVLGEERGDVAPLEELCGRNGFREPG